jgi:hypothetical protein
MVEKQLATSLWQLQEYGSHPHEKLNLLNARAMRNGKGKCGCVWGWAFCRVQVLEARGVCHNSTA